MFSQSNGLYNVPIQDSQMPNMQYQNPMLSGYSNGYPQNTMPNNGYRGMQQSMPSAPQMSPNSYPMQYGAASQSPMPYQGYASGGSVHKMAEEVQEHGRNGDTVLAHINPLEQHLLKMYGGSGEINPETGLHEYGGKFWKKALKFVGNTIIPAALGTYFGGPLGGIAASAAMGAASRGKGNKLKGALHGGLGGLGYTALAPMAGNLFGVAPGGLAGRAMGMNSASLLSQLGLSSAPKAGGGIGLIGNAGNAGVLKNMYGDVFSGAPKAAGLGLAASNLSGFHLPQGSPQGQSEQVAQQGMNYMPEQASGSPFGGRDLLTHGLLGLGLAGTALRREKMPKTETLEQYMTRTNQESYKPKKARGSSSKYNPLPSDRTPGVGGEHLYFEDKFPEYYHDGGRVHGDTNGLRDVVDAKLAPGEYVFMADAVSNGGGGNTESGIKVMNSLHNYLKRGPLNDKKVNSLMKALRS